ncbi:DUF1120 domain-containing protein [Andreprevotia chitinilytica]|uniref:DUF1120 domain-containing protein n=1 Tax=Andreprevotia chitinilytica TaxID=396808 RepID=UPI00055337AD|nr:DUF1120 domain-containing protein [Andreprevotia chitinilytica]
MKQLNLRKTLLATLLIGSASLAAAAATSTLDLTVGGTISPAPCTLDFSAGNTVDFGETKASLLKAGAYYDLGTKDTTATLTCSAAIKVGLRSVDDKASSALKDAAMLTALKTDAKTPTATDVYGLGTQGTTSIGAYIMYFSDAATFDGTKMAQNLYSTNGGTSWSASPNWFTPSTVTFSAASSGLVPAAARVMTYPIRIHAALNKREALNLVNTINLDGSATFEMVYL